MVLDGCMIRQKALGTIYLDNVKEGYYMELKMVNELIEKFTHKIDIPSIKNHRRAVVILFVMSACILLNTKNVVLIAFMFILTVSEFVYFSVIIRKQTLTLYNGTAVNIISLLQLSLSFNICMYGIQRDLGYVNGTLTVVIYLAETLCLYLGFLFTYRCVKNGTVHKLKVATASAISVLPGVLGMVTVRIIGKVGNNTQSLLYTGLFSFSTSLVLFSLGMTYVAILYFIKKYDIPNHELNR